MGVMLVILFFCYAAYCAGARFGSFHLSRGIAGRPCCAGLRCCLWRLSSGCSPDNHLTQDLGARIVGAPFFVAGRSMANAKIIAIMAADQVRQDAEYQEMIDAALPPHINPMKAEIASILKRLERLEKEGGYSPLSD